MKRTQPLARILVLACLWTATVWADGPASTTPTGPPSLVLISIDTLRSDRLPAYGYGGVETPAIDRLRRDGILFRRAYSHVPLTLPSHVSMFTGELPSEHGIRDNQGYPFVADEDFLPRRLQRLGYATAGAVSAFVLHHASGFGADGFDLYDDAVDLDPRQTTLGGVDRGGQRTLDTLEPWLRRRGERPFFVFLHLFEPHLPHTPPSPFAERYGATYEGEIAAADAVVGRLFELLDSLGLYDDAAIMLVSDHGEGLGDHGEQEHGIFLYREALQVPLLLKLPDQQRRGEAVDLPVQLVDVYPTFLHAAGEKMDDSSPGRALQTLKPSDPARPIYAETFYPRLHYGWSELTSLILDRHHLIAGPAPELFDMVADPAETVNLVSRQRRRAGQLRDHLVALRRPLAAPQPVDPATQARLAALGYLSGSATESDDAGPLPDPKAQIGTLGDLTVARQRRQEGKTDDAVAAYRRLLAANPRMLDGWHALADLLRRTGHHGEAAEAYGRAVELTGGDADFLTSMLASQIADGQLQRAAEALAVADHLGPQQRAPLERQLASALARRGRPAEAIEQLRRGNGSDPLNRTLLAQLLIEGNRLAEAEGLIADLVREHPDLAAVHEVSSLASLEGQSWGEAVAAAERAVALDPQLAAAWNNLGVGRWYLDRRGAAIEAWQRAVALDATAWDTLYNLGSKAIEVDRLDIARDSLKSFIDGAPADAYGSQLRRARVLLRRLER